MEAQTQRWAWTTRSCGGWPRDQRMSCRISSCLRRTEGCQPGDLWELLCSIPTLSGSRGGMWLLGWPRGQAGRMPWGKGSRWWMGLYFYNMKDQKVLNPVQISGGVAMGIETSTVESVYHCTPQLREARVGPCPNLSPNGRLLKPWRRAVPVPDRANRQGQGQGGLTCLLCFLCHSLVFVCRYPGCRVPGLSVPGSTATPRKF